MKCSHLCEAKLIESIVFRHNQFLHPDIRTFITDESFLSTMKDAEKYAWVAFKDAITKFLGKTKDPEYKNIVEKMLRKFKIMGCSMFIKFHFLRRDIVPEYLGAMSEE